SQTVACVPGRSGHSQFRPSPPAPRAAVGRLGGAPMGMEMKLQFKLSQQLVMTPQLVQAIRLLQLSRLELVDEIRKELDGNPVLADDMTDPKLREGEEKQAQTAASNEARLDSMERSERDAADPGARDAEKH